METVTVVVQIVGVVGSVASIVPLFRAGHTRKQRFQHAAWAIAVAFFAGTAVWAQNKLSRTERVEHAASELIYRRNMNYTDEGFIQAALTFLEHNKDLYPESYARAQELCRQNSCLATQHADGSNSLHHGLNQVAVAFTLEGMLRGIAIINRVR